MPNLIVLVGPQGSGKSTVAEVFLKHNFVYVNQDTQGREGCRAVFKKALEENRSIVIDRINHSREQRAEWIVPAKDKGYKTIIKVIHESWDTCYKRMCERKDHPTIKDAPTAMKALRFFFTHYERVEDSEADAIDRVWPSDTKPTVIVSDIDGTVCDISHRLKYVKGPGKKDWKSFFKDMDKDELKPYALDLNKIASSSMDYVFCSGRPAEHYNVTKDWLTKNHFSFKALYMRPTGDYRSDDIVKEILLEFELLTRYNILFVIDDRKRVVDMWRKRGLTCLQCAEGEF